MKIFEAHISTLVRDFFKNNLLSQVSLEDANNLVQSICGITTFFETEEELIELKEQIVLPDNIFEEPDRTEYGDFQTNSQLASSITERLLKHAPETEIVIEPTCGKGNFILSVLKTFSSLKRVYGIEVYKPYVWETKFSVLNFFLQNPEVNKPEIVLQHFNVFDFDFVKIASKALERVLIIGNPPWVTNSMLGSLSSANLPSKSNFKRHAGLDAMTGKGNFDIAEYITLMLITTFQNINSSLALLVKNSVVKNILLDQKKKNYRIGNFEMHSIDTKIEFNVSVEASLLFCDMNISPSYQCKEFNFYNSTPLQTFGWVDDKFVSNIDAYAHSRHIDGKCSFEWRQGLKHDCSTVMEFDKVNGHYVNALKEETELEDELVYGLLKSSDLKNTVINTPRKYTIVTQKKPGQDTSYIGHNFPKTYTYLKSHRSSFDARKSSIYKDKPSFSIFGIGDYSFKPYKVVISGFYKTFHFTLVLPENEKPLMLDDTCYMLAFDNIDYAVYTLILLNSKTTKELLQAITFSDAKRTFTKDVLMRIDLYKLSTQFLLYDLEMGIEVLNEKYALDITTNNWNPYVEQIITLKGTQLPMFA